MFGLGLFLHLSVETEQTKYGEECNQLSLRGPASRSLLQSMPPLPTHGLVGWARLPEVLPGSGERVPLCAVGAPPMLILTALCSQKKKNSAKKKW